MVARFIGAAALALALFSTSASATDIPGTGLSAADIVSWLKTRGLPGEIITGSDGKVHVRTNINNTISGVYMFDCKNGPACGSIQFSTGWATKGTFNTSDMNRWNRDQRWCRGYFDNVNDPWLEMDVSLESGVTYEGLNDLFAVYQQCMGNFTQMYNLKK